MALRIRCKSCDTANRFEEEDRGSRIRCRECDRLIRVPALVDDDNDDEEEPAPKKKKRKKAKQGPPTLLILGGVAAVVLLMCIGGGTVIGLWVMRTGREVARVVDNANRVAAMNPGVQRPVAKGKVILDQRGRLNANDPPDPTPDLREVNARMKVHLINLDPGKTYVITLKSDDFDPYLRLESPAGKTLEEDDDGGDDLDLDARIDFRPTQKGQYRVIATAWDGMLGSYQLKVQELD